MLRSVRDGEHRLLDAFETLDRLDVEIVGRQFATGHDFIGRAQRRFHHAAGIGENIRRAGRQSQRRIHLAIGQFGKGEIRLPNHARQFARGQDVIHVLHTARGHLGALGLILFGRAGHNGHHHQILGPLADFGRIKRLGHCAEHLLRRFARGQMRQQVGVIIFCKVDPPRRATGEHRQRGGRVFIHQRAFQAAQQLGALLHDGEVRGKVGIEHRSKAHLA